MQEVSKQRSSSQQILADDLMLCSQDWNMAEILGLINPIRKIRRNTICKLLNINTIYYLFYVVSRSTCGIHQQTYNILSKYDVDWINVWVDKGLLCLSFSLYFYNVEYNKIDYFLCFKSFFLKNNEERILFYPESPNRLFNLMYVYLVWGERILRF